MSLITETFDYDGGREITIYAPRDPPEAILYVGDGEMIAPWGADLAFAGGPRTMFVGVHRSADETQRLHEYSPGFDPDRFAAHERFFVDDVGERIRSRYGLALARDRVAIFGVSAGAELALALGERRPEVFGAVLCASPGAGYQPHDGDERRIRRAYLVAGRQEPFFRANAIRWADALRVAGADVLMMEREGTHGGVFWRTELPLMAAWAFGR